MKVTVLSFSYKRGLPEDSTGNGGGFVFDCRALPNPFWDETLRSFTGKDAAIAEFFKKHDAAVERFLSAALSLVMQSVEEYIKDRRANLQVAFGCTGGQHRSVYCAERMAEKLRALDDVDVSLVHAAREHWRT